MRRTFIERFVHRSPFVARCFRMFHSQAMCHAPNRTTLESEKPMFIDADGVKGSAEKVLGERK